VLLLLRSLLLLLLRSQLLVVVLLFLLLQLLGTATALVSTKVFEELAPSLCSRRN
jgi:hypothetical protein